MIPIRIDGPAVEPVSLAEARVFLRLDDDDTHENDLVLALIQAGRLLLESATRLIFVTQNWRLTLSRISGQGVEHHEIRLPLAPIIAITQVRALDEEGAAQTVDPALYRLRPGAVPPLLVLTDGFPGAPGGIEIDLEAGFGPDASQCTGLRCDRHCGCWWPAGSSSAATAGSRHPPSCLPILR